MLYISINIFDEFMAHFFVLYLAILIHVLPVLCTVLYLSMVVTINFSIKRDFFYLKLKSLTTKIAKLYVDIKSK